MDREFAHERKTQALWYAFGRKDAGEDVDPLAFSMYAFAGALDYVNERVVVLPGIEQQYNDFRKLEHQPAGSNSLV